MTDAPGWYSAQYHSEPSAENVFSIEAFKYTKLGPEREMLSFISFGGKLTDWLKMKETK